MRTVYHATDIETIIFWQIARRSVLRSCQLTAESLALSQRCPSSDNDDLRRVTPGVHDAFEADGAETKILVKATIKQIDRVISDLVNQVNQFRRSGGNPICVAFIGINFAEQYVSFEGRKRWRTDGKKYKHPIQEAAQAEQRLNDKARSAFDEFQTLRFRATNAKPYPFNWVDLVTTELEYSRC